MFQNKEEGDEPVLRAQERGNGDVAGDLGRRGGGGTGMERVGWSLSR